VWRRRGGDPAGGRAGLSGAAAAGQYTGSMQKPGSASHVRLWACLLGWPHLRRYRVRHKGVVHTFYGSGRLTQFRLQINAWPPNQHLTYEAMVDAFPYRLRTPWCAVRLTPDKRQIAAEARRVRAVLGRNCFATEAGRRRFRRLHPDSIVPIKGGRLRGGGGGPPSRGAACEGGGRRASGSPPMRL
jgi:hypothetical protein